MAPRPFLVKTSPYPVVDCGSPGVGMGWPGGGIGRGSAKVSGRGWLGQGCGSGVVLGGITSRVGSGMIGILTIPSSAADGAETAQPAGRQNRFLRNVSPGPDGFKVETTSPQKFALRACHLPFLWFSCSCCFITVRAATSSTRSP